MYFGSVKFFKHAILATLALLIIGMMISTIYLLTLNNHYKKQVAVLQPVDVIAKSHDNQQKSSQQCEALEYQKLYPDMYVAPTKKTTIEPKTVYLTFDDGPSDRTIEILDILKVKNIKATFFIVGREGEKKKTIMNRIVEEGHTIGIHTYSHSYKEIYKSVDSYIEDFNETYNLIYDTTGIRPEVFRFPGGSINKYNSRIHDAIIAEMMRRGFTYYDWNASSGDAEPGASKDSVLRNSIYLADNKERVILLMHDNANKIHTVSSLPDIIESFASKGFAFERITKDVMPIAFDYKD